MFRLDRDRFDSYPARMSENLSPSLPRPPGPAELLLAFSTASISGFGGVLPFARRMVVEQRRWMTAEEFNDAFALCQFLPGPNIVNFAVVFGARFGGGRGAALALLGVLGPPMVVVMILGALYARFGEVAALQRALAGLAAAAAGLIIAVSAKMAAPVFREWRDPAPFVALAIFGAIGLARLPLPFVLAAAVPASIGLAWWWRR
jgi:chromate transporter